MDTQVLLDAVLDDAGMLRSASFAASLMTAYPSRRAKGAQSADMYVRCKRSIAGYLVVRLLAELFSCGACFVAVPSATFTNRITWLLSSSWGTWFQQRVLKEDGGWGY